MLQGEGGTIGSLMSNTASLTNALADRDELIGQVIDNLSSMLKTVDDRHEQLSELVVELKNWMTNLAHDRKAIGASVTNLSGLTAEVANLLTLGRPYLKADVAQLRRMMKILNKPKQPGGARRGAQPAAADADRARPAPAPTAPGTSTTSATSTARSSCPTWARRRSTTRSQPIQDKLNEPLVLQHGQEV